VPPVSSGRARDIFGIGTVAQTCSLQPPVRLLALAYVEGAGLQAACPQGLEDHLLRRAVAIARIEGHLPTDVVVIEIHQQFPWSVPPRHLVGVAEPDGRQFKTRPGSL